MESQIIMMIKRSFFFVLVIVFIGTSGFSCSTPRTAGITDQPDVLYVFRDNWESGVDTPFIQEPIAPSLFAGELVPKEDPENPENIDKNDQVFRMDFSMLTTGGRNGVNVKFKSNRDLREYNALTFWARSDSENSVLEKIIITNGKDDTQYLSLRSPVFGNQWRKVTIPIFNGIYLRITDTAVKFDHSFDAGGTGTKLDINDLQFEKGVDLSALVDRIDYEVSAPSLWARTSAPLPKTIYIYLNDMGTGDAVLEDTTESMVSWISDNINIARVDGKQITTAEAGFATIRGKLKGTDIVGPAISVTSIAERTEEKQYIYLDGWGRNINTDQLHFQEGDASPNKFTIVGLPGGRTDGEVQSSQFIRLDFSMLQAGGMNGMNTMFRDYQNLGEYNALTFWAKSNEADSVLEKIIVTNGREENKNLWLKHSGETSLDRSKNNVFGNQWRKIIIPIFSSGYLSRTNTAVQFVHSFDSGGGAGAKLDIDELQYEMLDEIQDYVDRIEYNNDDVELVSGLSELLPSSVTLFLNDMGTGDAVLVDTTEAMLTWTSSAPNIARLDRDGITAISEGIAIIHGTLNGTNIEGPDIMINVSTLQSENTFFLYLDDWQEDIDTSSLNLQTAIAPNGFTTNELPGGRTNIDGQVLQLDFSQLRRGGENGMNVTFNSNKDLSEYNALTFWARANAPDSEVGKIIVTNGKDDSKYLLLKHSGRSILDTVDNNVFGTEWRKVTIPVFDSNYLSDTSTAVQLIHDFDRGGAGPILDVDELRYEQLDDLSGLVERIDYEDAKIFLGLNTISYLPETVYVYLNDMGTGDAVLVDTTESTLTWTSEDTNIVTIDDRKITAGITGLTKIQGMLTGTNIAGPKISIEVLPPPDIVDRQYLYGSEAAAVKDLSQLTSTEVLAWEYSGSFEEGTIEVTDETTSTGSKYRRLTGRSLQTVYGGWSGPPIDLESYKGFRIELKQPEPPSQGKVAANYVDIIFEGVEGEIARESLFVSSYWSTNDMVFFDGVNDGIIGDRDDDHSQVTAIKYSFEPDEEILMGDLYLYQNSYPDPDPNRHYLYSKDTGAVEPPFLSTETVVNSWEYTGGYDNTIESTVVQTGGADSSSGPYLRLVGKRGLRPSGGWGNAPLIDFSEYSILVFSAKTPTQTSISFSIVDGNNREASMTRAINRSWQQYVMNLSEFTGVDLTQVKNIKYSFVNTNDEIHLDEVYLLEE